MPDRQRLLCTIADAILHLPVHQVVRVGLDGVDGAGKSMFGDELAQLLIAAGRGIIRASVDGFHNPRAIRYRLGRHSPEGYFRDSYDYKQLKALLLDPLSRGGNGRYRIAAFDHRIDQLVRIPQAQAAPGDILVFDAHGLTDNQALPHLPCSGQGGHTWAKTCWRSNAKLARPYAVR